MNTKTVQGQFTLKCLDQRFDMPFTLSKKKLLFGSAESCDLRISDRSISSYHAFFYLKGADGFMVKDLYSEAGVFVNGKRVDECFIGAGDVLTIGTISFSIEATEEEVEIIHQDSAILTVSQAESFELPPKAGLIYIDGEYCDIQFDESSYRPLENMPELIFEGDFIELEETAEALEIAHNVSAKKLEVITYMNGLMMDISYLNLKDGDYYLSPSRKNKFHIPFNTIEQSKIFNVKKGSLHFYDLDAITPSVSWKDIDLSDTIFLTKGAEQISFRLVNESTRWGSLPFLYRDREFYKQASKVFASVFLPLLVLLFVSVPSNEQKDQEIAVVYKIPEMHKPIDALEKSDTKAETLTSQTENSGHKDNQQNSDKVEMSESSQNKKVLAKSSAPAAAQAAPVPPVPVKSYEFKSSVAMNSLVGDAPKINTEGSAAKAAVKDATFNAGSVDDGQLVAGADIGVSKFNGSDKSGAGKNSYGSRGLASKAGFDSSYLEPKTVVMGSMDPELLRRILREYIPQFRHCYQQELIGKSDKIKGTIDLNFTIGPEGRVAKHDIKAKDTRFSTKGLGCMGQVLSLIDFPRPKGGGVVDVKQPLNFFAESEKI
jgi:pSer/pThr/pTyr-binding forkhead associated (FHA) protein